MIRLEVYHLRGILTAHQPTALQGGRAVIMGCGTAECDLRTPLESSETIGTGRVASSVTTDRWSLGRERGRHGAICLETCREFAK